MTPCREAYLGHPRRDDVAKLCRCFHVRRLEVFGSVTTETFKPDSSDLDFLVEFEPMVPENYADAYFGLLEGLAALFEKLIDLVSAKAIRNPYFAASVDATRQTIYAA